MATADAEIAGGGELGGGIFIYGNGEKSAQRRHQKSQRLLGGREKKITFAIKQPCHHGNRCEIGAGGAGGGGCVWGDGIAAGPPPNRPNIGWESEPKAPRHWGGGEG